MSQVNTLLTQRLKKSENTSKMAAMAKQSANGNLTSFSGLFGTAELSDQEKSILESILRDHAQGNEDFDKDLSQLIYLTSEVKAINNQAAILHGERIKKAHTILTRYRDGAFTAWLIAAYGNRQTPYNLMQYYEFYEALPKALRPQMETMPRQAIYTLATREGSFEKKKAIIENYNGETKTELLFIIRTVFPLDAKDRRKQNTAEAVLALLQKASNILKSPQSLTKAQKNAILALIEEIHSKVN